MPPTSGLHFFRHSVEPFCSAASHRLNLFPPFLLASSFPVDLLFPLPLFFNAYPLALSSLSSLLSPFPSSSLFSLVFVSCRPLVVFTILQLQHRPFISVPLPDPLRLTASAPSPCLGLSAYHCSSPSFCKSCQYSLKPAALPLSDANWLPCTLLLPASSCVLGRHRHPQTSPVALPLEHGLHTALFPY